MRWFDKLVPLLSDEFRVIRADLLGHGFSSKPGHGYSPQSQARVLRALLVDLDVVDPVLVGHSLGADVAVSLVEQGFGVSKLVIINEAPDYTLVNRPFVSKLLRLPVLGEAIFRMLPTSAYRPVLASFLAPGRSLASTFDDVTQTVDDADGVPYACFRDSQDEKERFVADQPLDQRLAALGISTLVMFGGQDQVCQSDGSCARYRNVPGVTVEILPESGHSPMLENPTGTAEIIRKCVVS